MTGKKIRKAINHFITAVMFAVLLIMLFLVLSMKASGGEASLFGYQVKSVLSGSMEPDIQTGSVIFVKLVEDDQTFSENDIITFVTEDGMTVTHRIQEVQNEQKSYVTKGDANDGADIEPVLKENIIGIYKGITIPYLGYVMAFLTSNEGIALLFMIAGISTLMYAIIQIGQAFRDKHVSKDKRESTTN